MSSSPDSGLTDGKKTQSWWRSLPGWAQLVGKLTGLVVAIAGLLGVLHTAGVGPFQPGTPSAPAGANSSTPSADVAHARVSGLWAAKLIFLSSNFTPAGTRSTAYWRVDPGCATGACDVTVTFQGLSSPVSIALRHHGATYSGQDSALINCAGQLVLTDVSLSLRVTKADLFRGQWRALAFSGSYDSSSAATEGCSARSAHRSVSGTLNPNP